MKKIELLCSAVVGLAAGMLVLNPGDVSAAVILMATGNHSAVPMTSDGMPKFMIKEIDLLNNKIIASYVDDGSMRPAPFRFGTMWFTMPNRIPNTDNLEQLWQLNSLGASIVESGRTSWAVESVSGSEYRFNVGVLNQDLEMSDPTGLWAYYLEFDDGEDGAEGTTFWNGQIDYTECIIQYRSLAWNTSIEMSRGSCVGDYDVASGKVKYTLDAIYNLKKEEVDESGEGLDDGFGDGNEGGDNDGGEDGIDTGAEVGGVEGGDADGGGGGGGVGDGISSGDVDGGGVDSVTVEGVGGVDDGIGVIEDGGKMGVVIGRDSDVGVMYGGTSTDGMVELATASSLVGMGNGGGYNGFVMATYNYPLGVNSNSIDEENILENSKNEVQERAVEGVGEPNGDRGDNLTVDVPELGGGEVVEDKMKWWIFPVMALLALGVAVWWIFPIVGRRRSEEDEE